MASFFRNATTRMSSSRFRRSSILARMPEMLLLQSLRSTAGLSAMLSSRCSATKSSRSCFCSRVRRVRSAFSSPALAAGSEPASAAARSFSCNAASHSVWRSVSISATRSAVRPTWSDWMRGWNWEYCETMKKKWRMFPMSSSVPRLPRSSLRTRVSASISRSWPTRLSMLAGSCWTRSRMRAVARVRPSTSS
eukprot:Amastigsp_a175183_15.p3 type:complete len:193 gc:universal Amastigsp_a175183_15:1113-535(-)